MKTGIFLILGLDTISENQKLVYPYGASVGSVARNHTLRLAFWIAATSDGPVGRLVAVEAIHGR
jgi:hypothetical protein